MGLPVHLVAAVNCNDIIHRTVQRGDFSLSDTVKPTLASAMDIQVGPVGKPAVRCWVGGMDRAEIRVTPCPRLLLSVQVPYNMERIFWLLSGSDSQMTRGLMEQFERTQNVRLPEELQSKVSHSHTTEKGKGAAPKHN